MIIPEQVVKTKQYDLIVFCVSAEALTGTKYIITNWKKAPKQQQKTDQTISDLHRSKGKKLWVQRYNQCHHHDYNLSVLLTNASAPCMVHPHLLSEIVLKTQWVLSHCTLHTCTWFCFKILLVLVATLLQTSGIICDVQKRCSRSENYIWLA